MTKILLLTLLLLAPVVVGPCDKKRPQPQPMPTATPTVEPTPQASPTATPRVKPTPYPVPAVDLAPYLHEQGGRVVQVDVTGVEDAGVVINKAGADLDAAHQAEARLLLTVSFSLASILLIVSRYGRLLKFAAPLPVIFALSIIPSLEGGKLVISGGGKIKTQVVLKHDSQWSGEYFCDVETWEGCVLLRDNTTMQGGTFHEPNFIFENVPSITVIQTYASAKNNYASCENVTVKGVTILGRQTKTDGGVRQAISFGNCKTCAAIENELTGIASIGIQFGGGAADGNHAENALAYRNKVRRFAAAAIAGVNVKGFRPSENIITEPGRRRGEPGGISGIDIETNGTDDCASNIIIDGNYIGFGNAAFQSIGNGILAQNVYKTPCSGGLLIANNVIDGWEGRNGLAASEFWGLSGGLYFVGNWPGGLSVNNTIIRALQPAMSFYGVTGLTSQDDEIISSGGGGQGAIYLEGSTGNAFIRLRRFDNPAISPGSTGHWVQCDETSGVNVFKDSEVSVPGVCKQ